jgi:hypothetical protein
MYRSVEDFCRAAKQRADQGDVAGALEMISEFVLGVISRQTSHAEVFSSRQLDRLCLELGRLSPVTAPAAPDPERIVFLVTALAKTGGHSRVVQDIRRADPASKAVILITNTFHDMRPRHLVGLPAVSGASAEVAPVGNLAMRLEWVKARLASLRPVRTYILQHHFDPLCIAAAQPELAGRLFYYHNCDHALALGVHAAHAIHVDYNAKSFYHCREQEGLANNVFWPLTASVERHRLNRPFLSRGYPTTATSGGVEKFAASHFIESVSYNVSYADIVPLVMRTTRGMHIHIGVLPKTMLQAIAAGLSRAGVPRNRFVHLPYVRNLAAALVDHRVDAYLGSFPLGGGRATVEVMGAGLPLLVHSNYQSIFYSDVNEVYSEAPVWRYPDELIDHLKALTPEMLQRHASLARAFFEAHHRPERLSAALAMMLDGKTPENPPRPIHHGDALQYFLDKRCATDPDYLGGFPSLAEGYGYEGRSERIVRRVVRILARIYRLFAGPRTA